MKNLTIGIAAVTFLTLSCTNGSAYTPGSAEQGSGDVKTMGIDVGDKNQTSAEDKAVKLTKQDFLEKVMNYEKNQTEWVYEGDLPAIVDFYADWCGPCKIASPVLEELAKEYEGKIYVYKVDTDKEQELAGVFGIQSIPSFLFVPQNGKPTMSSGIAQTPEDTKKMFKQMIDQILLGQAIEKL